MTWVLTALALIVLLVATHGEDAALVDVLGICAGAALLAQIP